MIIRQIKRWSSRKELFCTWRCGIISRRVYFMARRLRNVLNICISLAAMIVQILILAKEISRFAVLLSRACVSNMKYEEIWRYLAKENLIFGSFLSRYNIGWPDWGYKLLWAGAAGGKQCRIETRLVSIVRLLVLPGKAAGLAMDGKAMWETWVVRSIPISLRYTRLLGLLSHGCRYQNQRFWRHSNGWHVRTVRKSCSILKRQNLQLT